MQRTGWFKSLWNRMFGKAPQPQTEGAKRIEAPKVNKKKPWFQFDYRKHTRDNFAFNFLQALADHMATRRGIKRRILAKVTDANPSGQVHYVHHGHRHRKPVKSRAERRRDILERRVAAEPAVVPT